MTLALQTYPDNTDYVNKIINNIASQLNSTALASDEIVDMLKRLLLVPLESYNNVLTVLKLEKYGDIIHSLGYEQRKFIALSIVRCENYDNGHKISTFEQVNKLFDLIRPLLKDEEDQTTFSPSDDSPIAATLLEDFEEEQNLIARLVHLFDNSDTDQLFKVLAAARKHFGQGGVKRIQYTLVPLVFSYLKLAQRIYNAHCK
jgi:vacuolar protein sorting-associated protein 35